MKALVITHMKYCKTLILSIIFFNLFGGNILISSENENKGIYSNGIAAVVEGRIITVSQLNRRIYPIVDQIRLESRSEEDFKKKINDIQHEILQDIIDKILIVNEFKSDQNRFIPEAFLESRFNEVLRNTFQNDRTNYIKYLQVEGKTDKQYRSELEDKIIIGYMEQQHRHSSAGVSPSKIREFYEKNKIRFYQEEAVKMHQITLKKITNESNELLLQDARKIVKNLKEGAVFSDLARKKSVDAMAEKGGYCGWIARKDMQKKLGDAVFTINSGDISDPILIDDYIIIVLVEEKRAEGFQPLYKVLEKIEETLAGSETRRTRKTWIEGLRKNAFIKYYL